MKAESLNINWDYLNPAWIFGPILDKELRVSSRRKRNYYLRTVYVVLLALFILSMWLTVVTIQNASSAVTYQVSRSAQIGKQITIAVIWFQFIVSQILAMVMLSSSISDEIRTGTLNVLMTTPVNSFQIVTGKLFSKLLQIILLLAISLPLLAIIRVFGGTQWNYVIFSLFITLASVIFAGSLSLFLSVFSRHAQRVIVLETLLYFVFFIIPFIIQLFALIGLVSINKILVIANPFGVLLLATERMSSGSIFYIILFHCLFMLGISGVFLGISIWKIRSAALYNVSSRNKNIESKRVMKDEKGAEIAHYYEFSGDIRRVGDNPIIWKENYGGLFGKGKIDKIITILIYLFGILGVTYLLFAPNFGSILVSLAMSGMYIIMMVRLAVSTAGSISSEKEAGTLPILLVTPLEDKDIILGKAKAGIRRNLSFFILYLFMQFSLFYSYNTRGLSGLSQLIYQIPLSIVSIASAVLFIVGCGSYFGVRMKNAISAIAATIGTYLVASFLIGIFNPVRLFLMFGARWFVSNPNMAQLIGYISSFFSVILFGGIGLYFLRKSIRNLRSSIF